MSDLIFETLSMSNFKTFVGTHNVQLNRKPGLYYITGTNKVAPELGANGVGKSTIWDALTWVLWGRTGRDNRPADAVKPWEGKKGQTSVSVSFLRGADPEHVLELTRTRNPNSLYYRSHSEPEGCVIEQDQVPKLLGMSEEMFRRTLVLGQFGTLFLDLKPEQQAQMFTEALDLDVWLRAIEAAGDQARGAQRDADRAQGDMVANERSLVSVAEDIKAATVQADTFAQDQVARIAKGERGIASLETDLKAAQAAAPAKPVVPDGDAAHKASLLLQTAQDNVRDDKSDLRDIEKQREADQKKLDALSKAKPDCEACGQPITNKQAARLIEQLQQSIREYVTPENKAKRTLAESEATLVAARTAYDKARTAYDKAKETYQPTQDKYEAAIRKVASIQGELKRWREQLAAVMAEKNVALVQVQRLKARRSELREQSTTHKENYERALAAMEHAKFWQDGFREIRLSIIDQTLVELEIATSRHAAMLGLNDWGVKFDTSRETKSGTVSYAFSVLLYPPGQDTPVKWESYSGGESQRWQLATAFALSEVLLARAGLSPNIEVLDEPTRGLSAGGVSDLLEHLRDRALELGRSIYFVDHHSLDKGAFDATLMVTKTKKGSAFAWQ